MKVMQERLTANESKKGGDGGGHNNCRKTAAITNASGGGNRDGKFNLKNKAACHHYKRVHVKLDAQCWDLEANAHLWPNGYALKQK